MSGYDVARLYLSVIGIDFVACGLWVAIAYAVNRPVQLRIPRAWVVRR